MKIVIDIPEDDYYDALQYAELKVNTEFENLMISAIKDGTPLPKGHGRLIDADMVCDELEGKSYSTSSDYHNAIDAINAVDDAPTIIEADKAESEE